LHSAPPEVSFASFEDARVTDAAAGARSIYHICPNVSRDEFDHARTVAAAARTHGIRRFVYHSVLHHAHRSHAASLAEDAG
jgi:hypothetical protein